MTPIDGAGDWIRRGFSPVPIPSRAKGPILQGWQRLNITTANKSQYFRSEPQNIGVLLGDRFGSADVDCDCPESIAAAQHLLPETGLIFGRPSKRFSHYFYRSDPPAESKQFLDPMDQKMLIELRGLTANGSVGLQTVVPPSIHISGESITFEEGFDGHPANIDADVLQTAVYRVAAAALLARHWPGDGSRHHAFLALAGVFARQQWRLEDAIAFHRSIYQWLWPRNPDWSAADSEVRSTFAKESNGKETTGIPTLVELIDKTVLETALRWLAIEYKRPDYQWNDTGNADRLADRHGGELLYCVERKSFYVWDGRRWRLDEFLEVEKRAEETMRTAFDEAKHISDAEQRRRFLRHINCSLSRNGLANMIHLAKKKVRAVSANDFDADPWLLNVANGIVDLKTGELRPHTAAMMLSKLIPIRYETGAECPLFLAFLYRIMGYSVNASDVENEQAEQLVAYSQRAFGCAATGKAEKSLYVLYGEGNNGKTTLLEVIRDVLGDKEYAGQVQVESLMMKPKEALSSNAVNTDLADLQGCRFVSSSETEQGQRLALSRVKYLTGLGQIRARRLRENMITFQPTYKLFLDCNHRPVISDPNDAIWNRVKCIPFKVEIPPKEIDRDLLSKLRAERPGILRWLVRGAVLYCQHGIGDAVDVVSATDEYRQDSDNLREFFEDRCESTSENNITFWKQTDFWAPGSELYTAYLCWADETGVKNCLSKSAFESRLDRLGKVRERVRVDGRQIRVWLGIRLSSLSEGQPEPLACDGVTPCDKETHNFSRNVSREGVIRDFAVTGCHMVTPEQ